MATPTKRQLEKQALIARKQHKETKQLKVQSTVQVVPLVLSEARSGYHYEHHREKVPLEEFSRADIDFRLDLLKGQLVVEYAVDTKVNIVDFALRLMGNTCPTLNASCAIPPHPLTLQMFGTRAITKEISESGAALYYLIAYLTTIGRRDALTKPGTHVYVLGDGNTPRTGYLFAMRHHCRVVSVDPIMQETWLTQPHLVNLHCIRGLSQDVVIDDTAELVIIIGVHSHADIQEFWARASALNKPVVCLSILCCKGTPQLVTDCEPVYNFQAPGILSEKNTVCVWEKVV